MPRPIILASASAIRGTLLTNAGLAIEQQDARVDEEALREGLAAEEAPPRDVADALAEAKARKISLRHPAAMVIGCDQVLEFGKKIMTKPADPDAARAQLRALRGQTHRLLSAAVIYEDGQPVWRHVGQVRLTMRSFSDAYLEDYVTRNWDSIRHSVGAYKLEEEGVRLFAAVQGDYFTTLGLPLIEMLNFLSIRGDIAA
ncbi:Maf family protein [Plastorhodobacter daqingensis]|uniref:Nucleoside triphosphate pyrophosphatase n=1 Tax=Plastorhodobacter daqingensis TaxID=1387281 RepID=A0ABW2UF76_9RHOB